MNRSRRMMCLALLVPWPVMIASAAEDKLPWAFQGERAEGYSIDLVAVDPAPGTPLLAGSTVPFRITIAYTLSVATHGRVVLVFQDEKNQSATPGQKQSSQEASGGKGELSFEDSIVVPTNAKELRLFIPIVPDGISRTQGEITLRYPITPLK